MISKISLGTVQFGQDYGIANTTGKASKEEVFKILDYANRVGVCCLDTAFSYGDSELIIGEYLEKNTSEFKIVSKLPSLEEYRPGKVEEFLNQSMQRMGVGGIYGYVLHKFTDIFIDDVWSSLVSLRDSGRIEKIGFSLYSPDELLSLLDREINFDIIQVPYSVFDQRFEKYFDILKKRGVEIQARSVFLQGLAFLNAENLPLELQEARPKLEDLKQIAEERNISIEALCLSFVLLNHHIDKVIIGVDSLMHFKKNVASIELMDSVREVYDQLREVKIEYEDVLLPYKWGVK